MPERLKTMSGLLVLLSVLLLGCQLFAAEFTADLVFSMPGQNDTLKLYVKDHAYRLEKLEGDNKMLLFRIKGATTALNPESKEYKVFKGVEENFINPLAAWENTSYDMQAKPGDGETINGYECRKYLYNYKGSDEIVFERWLSPELTFIVKQKMIAANGDAIMELINIKKEPVDGVLFEIPMGYKEAVDPEDMPIPVPEWAADLETAPVLKPPFEKVLKAGMIIKIRPEPGMSIWLRGKSTTETEAVAKAIPFKNGHPLKLATTYNNFAMKGTICERRHETEAEADYIVVHIEEGDVNLEAKTSAMFEKKVEVGGEFRMPISGYDNIVMRMVNLNDGESEIHWDQMKNGEAINSEYSKYRNKVFEKKNKSYNTSISADGDELVFKVTKGVMLIKAGQYDTFKF